MTLSNYPQIIDALLRPLIPLGAPLALFDFPNHSNVGDSAIWLGEIAYLNSHTQSRVIYSNSHAVPRAALPSFPSETVILIHGGGNFGDIWHRHHHFRLLIAKHYSLHRIIQLPQSIYFSSFAEFKTSSAIISRHPDFHLLVRDRPSLALAKELHAGNSQLCPDMALCLGSIRRPAANRYPVVALLRTDAEKAVKTHLAYPDMFTTDWLNESTSMVNWLTARVEALQNLYPRRLRRLPRALNRYLYERLASERMHRGCQILSNGRVVITDRLHAHILCYLMNIPHVVLDNSYRKIGNFRDQWHTGEGLCESASSWEHAVEIAREMLKRAD